MSLERRLLVVTESLGLGGAESHLIRLLPRLKAKGWQIAVFCVSGRGERAELLESANIEVFSLPKRASEQRSIGHIARAEAKLYAAMWRFSPRIAHFYLPGPYLMGAPLAIANKIPVKIMSRRSLSDYKKNRPIIDQLERHLHRHMDVVTANCRAIANQLIAEGIPERKVRVIYNGVEPFVSLPTQAHARQSLGVGREDLLGVIIANLHPYKGHRGLIEALDMVASRMPPRWRILCAGRGEGFRAELEELVRSKGLAGHVQFLRQTREVSTLLAAADFFLLTPTGNEGHSNSLLESMTAGLPTIVTDIGGNAETVVHEQTGLVVPPGNPAALGAAVLRLANDEGLRKHLGAAGRDRVAQHFSLEKCVEAHEILYDELLTTVERRVLRSHQVPAPHRVPRPTSRPLMLAYWGRYGALPQFTLELAGAAVRNGQASRTTISITSSNELFDHYTNYGDLIFPVETYTGAAGALNVAAWLRLRRDITSKLKEDGTRGFVTLMSHIWAPLATPVLRRLGIRHTVIVHDADPHRGDRTALVNSWLMREVIKADQIVTLTQAVAARLSNNFAMPDEKIRVLFHPELTYAPTIGPQGQPGPLRVLFFGRLLPYKGLSVFVGALEKLKQIGIPLQIGVFGAGAIGPERERLKTLGAEIVNKWIDAAEIPGILARHDLVVVSHIAASQSGVIATAHGAGLPVVVTPVGGLQEQVIPGVTGLVATEATPSAVAAAIQRCVEDRELLLSMRRGIMATRQDRSVDRFLGELNEIALNGR